MESNVHISSTKKKIKIQKQQFSSEKVLTNKAILNWQVRERSNKSKQGFISREELNGWNYLIQLLPIKVLFWENAISCFKTVILLDFGK